VPQHDAGAASAALNATQQVGGSLGTALLNTIAAGAIAAYLTDNVPATQETPLLAQVEGYSTAFTWAAGVILLAALVTAVFVKVQKEDLPTSETVAHVG